MTFSSFVNEKIPILENTVEGAAVRSLSSTNLALAMTERYFVFHCQTMPFFLLLSVGQIIWQNRALLLFSHSQNGKPIYQKARASSFRPIWQYTYLCLLPSSFADEVSCLNFLLLQCILVRDLSKNKKRITNWYCAVSIFLHGRKKSCTIRK